MSESTNTLHPARELYPFVSVVMPAHNEEQYIAECLQSLKSQSYPPDKFEIIVVDNNSTDRTAEIAASFGAIVLHKEKGPVGAVRNHGVKHANGEIIAFIDSDCVAPPQWLPSGAMLIEKNPSIAFGGGCYLREKPFFFEKYWLLSNNNKGTLPKHLIGATLFISKKLFLAAGMFDETITSGEDTKLSTAIITIGKSVEFSMALNVAHLGNPTTIASFFKRQIWHSENYFLDIPSSLRDPVFYLILIFASLLLASCVALFIHPASSLATLCLATLTPCALSIKRIKRANYKIHSLPELFYIYYLDLIYLLARLTGAIKSVFYLRTNREKAFTTRAKNMQK